MNPIEEKLFRCSVCGKYYRRIQDAESCCVGEKCPECGGQRDYQWSPLCTACRDAKWALEQQRKDQERWDAAKKVPLSEYDGVMVYDYPSDSYHYASDIDCLIDSLYDEVDNPDPTFPKYGVYGCEERKFGLVPEEIERLLYESDNNYEDFELSQEARKDIEALCDAYNAKHAETVYWPDYGIGIVADPKEGE